MATFHIQKHLRLAFPSLRILQLSGRRMSWDVVNQLSPLKDQLIELRIDDVNLWTLDKRANPVEVSKLI